MKRFTVPVLAATAMAGALSLTMSPVAAQSRAKAADHSRSAAAEAWAAARYLMT